MAQTSVEWHSEKNNIAANLLNRKARPDGFEPPTTWFEVGHSESRIIEQNQLFIAIELCHKMPRYPPISR
jgi:hypothetical protein